MVSIKTTHNSPKQYKKFGGLARGVRMSPSQKTHKKVLTV